MPIVGLVLREWHCGRVGAKRVALCGRFWASRSNAMEEMAESDVVHCNYVPEEQTHEKTEPATRENKGVAAETVQCKAKGSCC